MIFHLCWSIDPILLQYIIFLVTVRSVNATAFSKKLRSCYLIFRVYSPCLVQTTLQLSVFGSLCTKDLLLDHHTDS